MIYGIILVYILVGFFVGMFMVEGDPGSDGPAFCAGLLAWPVVVIFYAIKWFLRQVDTGDLND